MFCNEQAIFLNRLYSINVPNPFNNLGIFYPSIFIKGGSVDIYGSGSKTQPSQISDMILNVENSNISGYDSFDIIPKYIYITQKSGETTEIVLGGLGAIDCGELS